MTTNSVRRLQGHPENRSVVFDFEMGARLAHALNPRYLKLAFALFLAITAGRVLAS